MSTGPGPGCKPPERTPAHPAHRWQTRPPRLGEATFNFTASPGALANYASADLARQYRLAA
ncbi:hypothetical protein [Actinoplanes sp. NPDC020271]|uniref:hypothetical protein n=1 Tax=Actinoplanes sp. NPDC020271 TaxID=3363896 RepID=UPI00379D2C1A